MTSASTQDVAPQTDEEHSEPPPGPPPPWLRYVPAAAGAGAVAWLFLRPSHPHGVAAAADLLILPAALFAWVRLFAGRLSVRPAVLAALFGMGAVLATITSLVVERAADLIAGRAAMSVIGAAVEAAAACLPVVALVACTRGHRRLSVADLTVAGLTGGLGFLLVSSSLATASVHVAPNYVTPVLAGLTEVPASAGDPAAYFAGHALGAALVGLALGVGLRRSRVVGLVLGAGALALVTVDRGLFDWRLRHLVDGEEATASGALDLVQRITLEGRLAPALLVLGLVALRLRQARHQPEPPAENEENPSSLLADRATTLALVVAVTAGLVLVLLARSDNLDFLDSRPLAVVLGVVALGYSLWHLPSPDDPAPAARLRLLLGGAAVASCLVALFCAFLPRPTSGPPPHGDLFLFTVLGWGTKVGNLGVLLALGGLAAPAGSRGRRLFGDKWNSLLLRKLGWTGWDRAGRSGAGGDGEGVALGWAGRDARRRARSAVPRGGYDTRFLWFKLSGTRLGKLFGKGDRYKAPISPATEVVEEVHAAVSIRPVYRSQAPAEFRGETVKDAIAAAMRALGPAFSHTSLQLVDQGTPGTPGKAGSARPARVRVTDAREAAELFLVPPARDSITRDVPFAVVVTIAVDDEDAAPEEISLALRPADGLRLGGRTLTCMRAGAGSGTVRYRSNPYSVDTGEDTALADPDADSGAAGMRVASGSQVIATYEGESATITVYDSWVDQVRSVNSWLIDVTEEHHRTLVAQLEALLAEPDMTAPDVEAANAAIARLRRRLRSVAEARRILGISPEDDGEAAFRVTAALHTAMSVDDNDEPSARLESALEQHRALAAGSFEAFQQFLLTTAPGRLWSTGAYSAAEIARLLEWERLSDPPG